MGGQILDERKKLREKNECIRILPDASDKNPTQNILSEVGDLLLAQSPKVEAWLK